MMDILGNAWDYFITHDETWWGGIGLKILARGNEWYFRIFKRCVCAVKGCDGKSYREYDTGLYEWYCQRCRAYEDNYGNNGYVEFKKEDDKLHNLFLALQGK